MRGDRTADDGLTELMVVTAIEAALSLGVRRLSLNFAVLRSVFARAEQLGGGPVLRLWHRALQGVSRLWQIESLYRANAKYQPTWQPRYLCFPTARDLPRIGFAALTAEAFLPGPSNHTVVGQRPQPRRRRHRTPPVPPAPGDRPPYPQVTGAGLGSRHQPRHPDRPRRLAGSGDIGIGIHAGPRTGRRGRAGTG